MNLHALIFVLSLTVVTAADLPGALAALDQTVSILGVEHPIFNLDRVVDNLRIIFNLFGFTSETIQSVISFFDYQNLGHDLGLLKSATDLMMRSLELLNRYLSASAPAAVAQGPLGALFRHTVTASPLRPQYSNSAGDESVVNLPATKLAGDFNKLSVQTQRPIPYRHIGEIPLDNTIFDGPFVNLQDSFGVPIESDSDNYIYKV